MTMPVSGPLDWVSEVTVHHPAPPPLRPGPGAVETFLDVWRINEQVDIEVASVAALPIVAIAAHSGVLRLGRSLPQCLSQRCSIHF